MTIPPERWEAVEPLLDQALALSKADRLTWLDELRVTSPTLADELRALLANEEAADQRCFLAHALPLSLVGTEVGGYALERLLGEGGMGSVWLARRTDGRFEGQAAVKLMNLARL